ncbi:MAG: DUF2007 domain-containing protein [Verrucomicrobiota bacterium]
MKTVITCQNLIEAQMIQSLLQGSGIDAFIPDEFTVQNDWGLINAIGGIRLQVPDEMFERAKQIITDFQSKE